MKAIFEFDAPESCRDCELMEGLKSCSCDERTYYHCKATDDFAVICVEEYSRGKEITKWPEIRAPFCPLKIISDAPTVDAVVVGELQAAIDEAESTRDSIVGGSQFAPYMYAYLCLKESIEGLASRR